MIKIADVFTKEEEEILKPFVSNVGKPIFVLRNLPEVIKGALFSKYSRSTKGLRRMLLDEFIINKDINFRDIAAYGSDFVVKQAIAIEKAKDFYDRILDGFGDDSIGELGGAHVAVEDVSILASKWVEHSRIGGSPLEKSSRYVWFDKKVNGQYQYYRDQKIMNSKFASVYEEATDLLFDTYSNLSRQLTKFVQETTPMTDNMTEQAYKFSIKAKACDALRGLLPLSAFTNLGLFGNGRFFENMLIRLMSNPMAEAVEIAENMQSELDKTIPSFVRRCKPEHIFYQPYIDFYTNTQNRTAVLAREFAHLHSYGNGIQHNNSAFNEGVKLVEYDNDAENKVLAAILYPYLNVTYSQAKQLLSKLTPEQKRHLMEAYCCGRTNRRHKPGRAFENAYYTFDILADFGTYKDLMRHRILTQEKQLHTVAHGYITSPLIIQGGFSNEYDEAMKKCEEAYHQIAKDFPYEAQYMSTHAHRTRWYFTLNLRSLYWLCELRSGQQGHPTYRKTAQDMYSAVKKVQPSLVEYMNFIDMNDYGLGRLQAEMEKEERQKRMERNL